MRALMRSALGAFVAVLIFAGTAAAASTTESGGTLRNGWFPNAGISPGIVNSGTFGQLWSANVDGQVYAQPLVAGSGSSATVIAATETDHVYGLNASDGSQRWETTLGTPWNPATIACADIQPSIGTTSTPVIDPSTNTVYTSFKSVVNGSAVWKLAALDIATGQERPNFPVTLGGSADNDPSMTFQPTTQQQRTGLLLLNGVVYMGFGSHCDVSPWQGWVMGVSTTTGQITAKWVDTTVDGGGIWQAGTGLMSDGPGTILLTTGNGGAPQTPAPGSTAESSYGDSVVRLDVQPNGTLKPADFFSPFDAIELDDTDADFASGGIVGLPDTTSARRRFRTSPSSTARRATSTCSIAMILAGTSKAPVAATTSCSASGRSPASGAGPGSGRETVATSTSRRAATSWTCTSTGSRLRANRRSRLPGAPATCSGGAADRP